MWASKQPAGHDGWAGGRWPEPNGGHAGEADRCRPALRSEHSGIEALGDEFRADVEAASGIHRQDVDRGPPTGRESDDEGTPEGEMIRPPISLGVKQTPDRTAVGIDPRQIRT